MSRKQAKRQRFYAQQKTARWFDRQVFVFCPNPAEEWMLALMGDTKRIADELCGLTPEMLRQGEIGYTGACVYGLAICKHHPPPL